MKVKDCMCNNIYYCLPNSTVTDCAKLMNEKHVGCIPVCDEGKNLVGLVTDVSHRPVSRLRHWCSSQYLRISPLHWEFHLPLRHSSCIVSKAVPGLSPGLSLQTYTAVYAPFTPSKSG